MRENKKQTRRVGACLLAASLASIVFAVGASEPSFGGGQSGGGGTYDGCSSDSPMHAGQSGPYACFNSGVGWLHYIFSGDFMDGILIDNSRPYKIIRNPAAGHDYGVALVTDPEYDASAGTYTIRDGEGNVTAQYTVRTLTVNDIALGPGSIGNGDWLPIGENTVSGDMDDCRKNGDAAMYRNGLFEAKNTILDLTFGNSNYNAPAITSDTFKPYHNSAAGPTTSSTKYKVGITGKVLPYITSGNYRVVRGGQDVRYVSNIANPDNEAHNWLNAKKSDYIIDQSIFYDNVPIMSATSLNQAYNIDSVKVFKDYIKFLLREKGEQFVTDANVDAIYNALKTTGTNEGKDIVILKSAPSGYFGNEVLDSVTMDAWSYWATEYTENGHTTYVNSFCYSDNDDSTYTADTIIGSSSNAEEWYTKGSQYISDPSSGNIERIRVDPNAASYDITGYFYDIKTTSGHRPQPYHYGFAVQDLSNNGALHKVVNHSNRSFINSENEPHDEKYTVNFGDSKSIMVCSFIDYYANYSKEGSIFYNHVDNKYSCVVLNKEIHSSILWSKIGVSAFVGVVGEYNVNSEGGASCNQLNTNSLRISAAEAPVSNGSGRYNWSSAVNSGKCHIQAQQGKVPAQIAMSVSAARKAGVHEGDSADVLAGSDFTVNIGNGSGNDFSKNLSSMMDGGFIYANNSSDNARKPHVKFTGESTNFVELGGAKTTQRKSQLFPEQEMVANDTYTHPKIVKDMGNTNEASYRLEGQSNILTSSSSVNFAVVRDGFRCPDRFKNDSAYYYGINNGRNLASVDYIINDGINTGKYASGAGGKAYVRPGQGVQFVYNMCAGGTYTHMARTSSDGSLDNKLGALWVDSSNTHFTLKVEDATGDGKDYSAGYLFGKIPFGYNNQDTTATFSTQGNSQNISSNVNFLKIDNDADRQGKDFGVKFNAFITQYSLRTPSGENSEAAGKYSCSYGDISGPYYYYIGDGLGGICSKNGSDNIARRKEGWDLGRRFRESITYTHLVYENGELADGPYDVTTDATINTPFNYKTDPSAEISFIDNSYITAGDSLSVTANFNLEPITNNALTFFNNEAEKTYTTRSKSSLLVSFGFIVPSEKKSDFMDNYRNLKYVSNPDSGMTLAALCDAAYPDRQYCETTVNNDASYNNTDKLSLGDNDAVDASKTYILSSDGSDKTDDAGRAHAWSFGNRKYTVPDAYNDSGRIGDIVCVVSAIYPANSYNLGQDESSISANDGRLANGLSGENAGDGAMWALSKPSCTTISKKPTFSVEGGSLFVSGSINTYNGMYKSKAGNLNYDQYMYGSWSEYGIMLGGTNSGMASSAGYGYGSIGSFNVHNVNEAGRHFYPVKATSEKCMLSTQTVGNSDCERSASFGDGASQEIIKKIQGQLSSTLDDLKARYRNNTLVSSTGASATRLSSGQTIAGDDICYYDDASGEYRTKDGALGFCSSRGEQYFDISSNKFTIDGDINFSFNDRDSEYANQRNRTIIIRTKGTLMIDGNITIEDDGYSSIKQIPNVLIFADNVEVSDRVSQIDAWIIVDNTFNTCAFMSSDYSKRYEHEDELRASDCSSSLVINGPVSAGTVKLFRTAGAGTEKNDPLKINSFNYVVRAEIFNMTPATYLWARAQAESNSGLITTYVKELPVRY